MGDTWGREGPPDEAYSRVSRDLAAVTAGFSAWLDDLPGRLATTYDCVVREPTAPELDRLGDGRTTADRVYVVEPADTRAAALLVARTTHDGAAGVLLRTGLAIDANIPTCMCDACDEDSHSLVEQTEEVVAVATGGCREFRRRYARSFGQRLADGPWLEHGWERPDGTTSCHASASVRGEAFSRAWAPWPRRQAS